jgi:exo-1,4-beta-D-glucosaminidase
VTKAGAFPERAFAPESPVYFVDLTLKDQLGKIISTNFYWLSAKKNVYDWSAEDNDAFTPVKSYEDMTALNSLPSAGKLEATFGYRKETDGWRIRVKIRNPGDHLALQSVVEVRDKGARGETLPLLWDDNYVSLLPGESREITAPLSSPDLLSHNKEIRISGWNADPETLDFPEVQIRVAGPGASH